MREDRHETHDAGEARGHAGVPFQAAYDTWRPVFGTFLRPDSTLQENLGTLLLLGAHVVAVFVVLFGLKLCQWLS